MYRVWVQVTALSDQQEGELVQLPLNPARVIAEFHQEQMGWVREYIVEAVNAEFEKFERRSQ